MNLHVVAYPKLKPADYERIQFCRKEHNSLYSIIEPHFTIVFSVQDRSLEAFVQEIRQQALHSKRIDFCLRSAIICKDSFSDNYDAFLVPDEGFAPISKLHDKLYSDELSVHHRLDIAYIPHLSIAASPDPMVIKAITAQWNKQEFCIAGTIDALDIVNYENRTITTVERILLA